MPRVLYEDCNERLGGVPRLVEMMVEEPVRLRNMASCFVISTCTVRTLLDKQSCLEETLFAETM